MEKEQILKGIASYKKQQTVFLRLLKLKGGSFTERDFDRWFKPNNKKRLLVGNGISGDSFILGIGINGFTEWAEMLDLLQWMIRAGLIDAKTSDGIVVYSLPRSA